MAFVLQLAFLACLAHCVSGHGYLTHPTSRRLAGKKSQYTGITAFGAGQHITNCGKDGLSVPSSQDVVTDVQKGSTTKFDITIDAHHAGHLEMRLCPFIVDGDDQDLSSCTLLQRASAAEAGVSDCGPNDDRDICAPIDLNNPGWWYLAPKGPQGNVHSMWFHIPSTVNCPSDRCTVQFTWKTANSCNPHPAAYCNYYHDVVGPQNTWCNNWYCGGFCNSNSNSADNCDATMGNRKCCSEVFTNCAEVKLVGESSPVPSPSPTATAGPEPEPEPELEPEPEPTAEPTPAPTPTQTDGSLECDNGTGSCKDQCSKACGYDVQINQCWGSQRFIQCQCNDGSVHSFAGCACENSQCPSTDPTHFPTLNPTPAPSLAPTPSTLNPTPAPTFDPTPTPAPTHVSSSCIDVRGQSCQHCLASNNVCYAQQKTWCDLFHFTWCGAPSLVQEEYSPASRTRARSQGFLGLIQTALSLDSFTSREHADDFDEL